MFPPESISPLISHTSKPNRSVTSVCGYKVTNLADLHDFTARLRTQAGKECSFLVRAGRTLPVIGKHQPKGDVANNISIALQLKEQYPEAEVVLALEPKCYGALNVLLKNRLTATVEAGQRLPVYLNEPFDRTIVVTGVSQDHPGLEYRAVSGATIDIGFVHNAQPSPKCGNESQYKHAAIVDCRQGTIDKSGTLPWHPKFLYPSLVPFSEPTFLEFKKRTCKMYQNRPNSQQVEELINSLPAENNCHIVASYTRSAATQDLCLKTLYKEANLAENRNKKYVIFAPYPLKNAPENVSFVLAKGLAIDDFNLIWAYAKTIIASGFGSFSYSLLKKNKCRITYEIPKEWIDPAVIPESVRKKICVIEWHSDEDPKFTSKCPTLGEYFDRSGPSKLTRELPFDLPNALDKHFSLFRFMDQLSEDHINALSVDKTQSEAIRNRAKDEARFRRQKQSILRLYDL